MASGVYLTASRITDSSVSVESVSFGPISATTALFSLLGGNYGLTAIGTFTTCTLQKLAGDGSTLVTAATQFSAVGYETAYLSQGQYKWAIT
jgi:microcystin-dependent protein